MTQVTVETTTIFYTAGEWHINALKERKRIGGVTDKTEFFGDLSRCIQALPRYIISTIDEKTLKDVETSVADEMISSINKQNQENMEGFKKLKNAFIKAIKILAPMKPLEASKFSYEDFEASRDNHSIIMKYQHSTEHGSSESGIKKKIDSLPNYQSVALKILNIAVGEKGEGDMDIDSFCQLIIDTATDIATNHEAK